MARKRSKRGMGSSKRRKRSSPKSSHSKGAATSAGATVHTSHPTQAGLTLENFALLPYEIKTHILELACSPSPSSSSGAATTESSAASCSRRPLLDYSTTLSLSLSSRSLHALVAPILFRSVCITRPSALASFSLALQQRPQLGSLVKDLYVGPEDELPDSHYPLEKQEGFSCSQCSDHPAGGFHPARTLISHSLQSAEEKELLPRWCTPKRQWALDHPASAATPSKFVYEALREAQRTIDVDLVEGTTYGGEAFASRLDWMERVCEVQAALDLYLTMMRRWEEDYGMVDLTLLPWERHDYPSLVLSGYSMYDQAQGAGEPYIVTRSQLLLHLARRGSITDSFDHPLLFSRSGLDLEAIAAGQEVERKHNVPKGSPAGAWAAYLFSPPDTSPDYLLPNTATLGSLLSLLHSALGRLYKLENLALTGFLELAICSAHPTPLALPSVRSLSTGPPGPYDSGGLHLDQPFNIQCLRFCGKSMPEHGWLEDVVRNMPTLQHMQTNPGRPIPTQILDRLQASLRSRALGEATPVASSDDGSVSDSPSSFEGGDTDNGESSNDNVLTRPLIEMKLHPHDVKALLDSAPTAAVRAAWASGGPWSREEYRILISESQVTKLDDARVTTTMKDLYEEGRDWWEKHRAGRRP